MDSVRAGQSRPPVGLEDNPLTWLAFTDEESPYDELVTTTVLDFWHGTLDGDDEALDRVTADATDPDLSVVRHE